MNIFIKKQLSRYQFGAIKASYQHDYRTMVGCLQSCLLLVEYNNTLYQAYEKFERICLDIYNAENLSDEERVALECFLATGKIIDKNFFIWNALMVGGWEDEQ